MSVQFRKIDHESLAREQTLVDMHLHTKYSFDCATKPAAIIKMARKRHIGVAITDHNEIKGVKAVMASKDAKGVLIIPGIEITSKEFKDVLCYFNTLRELEEFYDRAILPHKTRIKRLRMNKVKLPMATIIREAKAHGGTVCVPHPFAIAKNSYKFFSRQEHHALLQHVDAIEVANGTQTRMANMASFGWTHLVHKPTMGGSDSHMAMTIGSVVTAAYGGTPTTFLEQVRGGNAKVFGLEYKKRVKIINNLSMLKNKLLKNKKIPLRV